MLEDIFQSIRIGDIENFISRIDQLDINSVNEMGQNMLHEAVAYKREECVDILLRKKINPNQQDEKGQTSLHYCAEKKLIDFARKILLAGGNVSISDVFGNEPLWTAVFNARGEYDTVKLFLENGADFNHKNRNNKSPLDFAIQIDDQDMIALINTIKSNQDRMV